MSTIHVKMLVGPYAGRVATFQEPTVSFGRAANLPIPIPMETVSRHHGDLQLQDNGSWVVVNHSNNGTAVNGKKVRKPRPLKSGDVISIAKQAMFEVSIEEAAPAPAAAAPSQAQAPASQAASMMGQAPGQGMAQAADALSPEGGNQAEAVAKSDQAKRSKLWMYLGIYMGGMFLVMFIILSVYSGGSSDDSSGPKHIDFAKVKEMILTYEGVVPENTVRNPDMVNEHLKSARHYFGIATSPVKEAGAAYQAYYNYTLAQFHHSSSDGKPLHLDVIDETSYDSITQRLAEDVTKTYESAYLHFKNGDYEVARRHFRMVSEMYPQPFSDIIYNVEDFQRYITKNTVRSR